MLLASLRKIKYYTGIYTVYNRLPDNGTINVQFVPVFMKEPTDPNTGLLKTLSATIPRNINGTGIVQFIQVPKFKGKVTVTAPGYNNCQYEYEAGTKFVVITGNIPLINVNQYKTLPKQKQEKK